MRVGTPGGLSDIYKDMDLGVHERTFKQWIAWGTNFAAIAGGGTIYVLILIAGLNLRVSLAHFDGATAVAIGNVLRNPPDGKVLPSFTYQTVTIHVSRVFAKADQGTHCSDHPSSEGRVSTFHGHVVSGRRVIVSPSNCAIRLLRYHRIR